MDRDGITLLLEPHGRVRPAEHVWLTPAPQSTGKDWVDRLGWTAASRHPPTPRSVWVREGERRTGRQSCRRRAAGCGHGLGGGADVSSIDQNRRLTRTTSGFKKQTLSISP